MKKAHKDKTVIKGKEKAILFKEEGDCNVKSTYEWVRCMEKEGNALICKTIKNNSYEDCES